MIKLTAKGQEKVRQTGLKMIELFEEKHNTTNGAPEPKFTQTSSGKAAHVTFIDRTDGAILAQEELFGADLIPA